MATDPVAAQPASPAGAEAAAGTPLCRNCGAAIAGAYCAACGQETRLRVPTLREFAREAGGRYVALDGVLWRTLGALLLRPGFLTREYLAGRRRRYVRPFRLYLAASLVTFLVAGFTVERIQVVETILAPGAAERGTAAGTSKGAARGSSTSERRAADDAAALAAADEVVISLPAPLKAAEGVVKERMRSFLALSGMQRARQLEAGTRRNAPYAMFVLVPAFALLLKLVYPGRRAGPLRPSRYGEHLVFAVHNHAFLFLALTLAALTPQPVRWLAWAWAPAYLVMALRAVYGGRWPGTMLRAGVLVLAYLPMIAGMIGVLIVAAVLVG